MIIKWNEYESVNENLQKARAILRRANVPETNDDFIKLRTLLSGHRGYLGKFTEWLIVDKIPYHRLEDLYDQMKSTRLSKPIDEFKTPEEIIDTIVRTTADVAVNQIIHSIPSRAREYLMFAYCDSCDNEKEITCTRCEGDGTESCKKCDGDAEVPCPKCDAEGTKVCKKCKGKGTYYRRECEECEGEGAVECDECGGDCSIQCDSCEGEGSFDCKLCEGECTITCPECATGKESPEWKEFVKFLALQAPHKDLIIDFFRKKGGRYSNDDSEWDYEDQTALEELTENLTRLIDLPSIDTIIDTIIERLPTEENLRLIHNDENFLIVACNYEGIQKYGSSYWCIHQDEGTYDDYVYQRGGICQQWILYVKGKTPLVDEKSVMGITYDIKDGVEYAHWEDDGDCKYDAIRMLQKVTLDKGLMFAAMDIFNHEDAGDLLLSYPDIFKSKIDAMFATTQKAIVSDVEFKAKASTYSARERNRIQRVINESKYHIIGVISEYLLENGEPWTPELSAVFIELCSKYKLIIPVQNEEDLAILAITKLYNNFEFIWGGDCSVDVFEILSDYDINDKDANELIMWITSKGYDLGKHVKSRYAEGYILPLYKLGLIPFEKFMKTVDLNDAGEFSTEITIEVLDNVKKYIGERKFKRFLDIVCDVLSKNNELFIKYKATMIDIVGKITDRNMIETILETIDDDDLEMVCARKLLHRKILTKYDVDMKKKMLEKLIISYKNFS